jgi:hypothetical protein
MRWPNGDVYDGTWLNGSMHGLGSFSFANGSTYVGEFKWGLRHGQGKFTFANRAFEYDWSWHHSKHGEARKVGGGGGGGGGGGQGDATAAGDSAIRASLKAHANDCDPLHPEDALFASALSAAREEGELGSPTGVAAARNTANIGHRYHVDVIDLDLDKAGGRTATGRAINHLAKATGAKNSDADSEEGYGSDDDAAAAAADDDDDSQPVEIVAWANGDCFEGRWDWEWGRPSDGVGTMVGYSLFW